MHLQMQISRYLQETAGESRWLTPAQCVASQDKIRSYARTSLVNGAPLNTGLAKQGTRYQLCAGGSWF